MAQIAAQLFAISIFMSLIGCTAEVWVVESNQGGGVIGYRDAERQDFKQKYETAAKSICGTRPYQQISDHLRSEQRQTTVMETQQTQYDYQENDPNKLPWNQNSVTGTATTQVPRSQNFSYYWREAEIRCVGNIATLGVRIKTNTPPNVNGAIVELVVSGSPAEQIGIQADDIITEVGYKKVNRGKEFLDVMKVISQAGVGTETVIQFCHGGNCQTRETHLEAFSH